ncbi:MAG: transposase [Gammaproteobacteria bacterium]|nr:transposase [Gammaproteobacteria bacterium]
MATEEKVTGSNDKPYRSVGVSRKRPRPFDANEAVLIKDHADTPIGAQRVLTEPGEVELYCHSSPREHRDLDRAQVLAKRFERAPDKLAAGLDKPRTVKTYAKVLERIARLEQRYARAAQDYYDIEVSEAPASANASALKGTRTQPIELTWPAVYGLRTHPTDWDAATVGRTYTMPTALEAVFRSRKGERGLRPIEHHKAERVSAHRLIAVLAYHRVHCIGYPLKAAGITLSRESGRRRFSGQERVTVRFKRADGRTVHVRKSTRAEGRQPLIHDALGLSHCPGQTQKGWM